MLVVHRLPGMALKVCGKGLLHSTSQCLLDLLCHPPQAILLFSLVVMVIACCVVVVSWGTCPKGWGIKVLK